MNRFCAGQQLSAIFFVGDTWHRVGENGVRQITVIMENGQMAGVAWALVEFDDDRASSKWNLSQLEGVELLPEDKE